MVWYQVRRNEWRHSDVITGLKLTFRNVYGWCCAMWFCNEINVPLLSKGWKTLVSSMAWFHSRLHAGSFLYPLCQIQADLLHLLHLFLFTLGLPLMLLRGTQMCCCYFIGVQYPIWWNQSIAGFSTAASCSWNRYSSSVHTGGSLN